MSPLGRCFTRLWVTGPPVSTSGGETTVMSQQADFTRLCEPGEAGGRRVFAKLATAKLAAPPVGLASESG